MKKAVLLFLLLSLLLSGCASPSPVSVDDPYRRLSMQEAAVLMEEKENYLILDVRTEEEYAAGHIPGAILIPNETIGTDELPQLPDKDQLIMVYCRSGNRSRQASDKLVRLGYTNIVEIGGINSWNGEIATASR